MNEDFVAIVVSVPDQYFSDDDDVCLAAGNFVCQQLEAHLAACGHVISPTNSGGCEEDWGVYFRSEWNKRRFDYYIHFFPAPDRTPQNLLLVQYHLRRIFRQWLLRQACRLGPDDPMHETMRTFGELFEHSRQLTQAEFDREY